MNGLHEICKNLKEDIFKTEQKLEYFNQNLCSLAFRMYEIVFIFCWELIQLISIVKSNR